METTRNIGGKKASLLAKRSKTEAIWYVSNKPNQTLKCPFGPETEPDCASASGANSNGPYMYGGGTVNPAYFFKNFPLLRPATNHQHQLLIF